MIKAFYSDPHFGHYTDKERNIITFCDRPFNTIPEMNWELICRYNEVIGEDDTVIWLGDCFFLPMDVSQSIMKKLNGEKLLIWGGHDHSFRKMLRMGFTTVAYEMTMFLGGRTCRLSHFPYADTSHKLSGEPDERFVERRPKKLKGEVLIHGHTHLKKKRKDNMIHVGVDAWNFYPALIEDVIPLIEEV